MDVSGQFHAPAALPTGKEPLALEVRLGRGGEEKISQPLPRLEPPIIRPVAQRNTTELSSSRFKMKVWVIWYF
jgi:hypothetical protein